MSFSPSLGFSACPFRTSCKKFLSPATGLSLYFSPSLSFSACPFWTSCKNLSACWSCFLRNPRRLVGGHCMSRCVSPFFSSQMTAQVFFIGSGLSSSSPGVKCSHVDEYFLASSALDHGASCASTSAFLCEYVLGGELAVVLSLTLGCYRSFSVLEHSAFHHHGTHCYRLLPFCPPCLST